jgi:hypothetical protein
MSGEAKERGQQRDQQFGETAGRMLRQSAEELDAATLSRLNQARQKALAELQRPAASPWISRWATLGAGAAAAMLMIALWTGRAPVNELVSPAVVPLAEMTDAATDFELLLEEDDLEMIADLEFFAWLSDAELDMEPGVTG